MNRRSLLKIAAAGPLAARLAAQHAGHGRADGELQFFSGEQFETVDRLAELILPADERSGGAHAAGVAQFIDEVAAHSGEAEQERWTAGLEAVDQAAQSRFGKPFRECAAAEQDAILAAMAATEDSPSTGLERFFALLKRHTLMGYYASAVGLHDELQYQGIVPIADYPACGHSEHGS